MMEWMLIYMQINIFTLSLSVFLVHPPGMHPFTESSIVQFSTMLFCSNGNIPLISMKWKGPAKT